MGPGGHRRGPGAGPPGAAAPPAGAVRPAGGRRCRARRGPDVGGDGLAGDRRPLRSAAAPPPDPGRRAEPRGRRRFRRRPGSGPRRPRRPGRRPPPRRLPLRVGGPRRIPAPAVPRPRGGRGLRAGPAAHLERRRAQLPHRPPRRPAATPLTARRGRPRGPDVPGGSPAARRTARTRAASGRVSPGAGG
ncbi:hypothetical protein SBRY_140002 [Actinacidiphila bryophytorum]|uniref:Uncharacterized protein n=1 Tax=Actinacidiphila bryophytorum TaxID=1436133 RepID=A0A9W4E3D3_9ACTN|nr:hypothetical protein SBRY_140002 [Actinacidiphila bryophytorum]